MAHEFIKGIDWVADATGNTALSGSLFVSKSGNDADAGTDPNLPKLTIAAAIAVSNGNNIIIGTGAYNEFNIAGDASNRQKLTGDGNVVLYGSGSEFCLVGNRKSSIENITFRNFNAAKNGTNTQNEADWLNCVFDNAPLYEEIRSNKINNEPLNVDKCIFINSTLGLNKQNDSTTTAYLRGCKFINSTFTYTTSRNINGEFDIANNFFDSNSDLVVAGTGSEIPTINNNCFNGSLTVHSVSKVYSDYLDCITGDPLFLGTPTKREFLVSSSSPLLRTGAGNLNIGDVKEGNLQNSVSTEWGTSPAVNVNTEFVSTELRPTGANISGTRTSSEIDLGQAFSGIIINQNAVLDFLNYTLDGENTMVNPNHLVFEVDWADEDAIYHGSFEKFRFGIALMYDSGGLYSGEVGFVASGIVPIVARYLKIRITVRNDYNEL